MKKARNIISNIKTTSYSLVSLGILAILAFAVLFIPIKTEAGVNYVFDSTFNINNNFNPNSGPNSQPLYQSPLPVQNYAPSPTNTQISYTIPTIDSTKKVATSAKVKGVTTSTKTDQEEDKYKNLAASAIFGDIGFMPSGLFQWILFAILILLIIILVRRIFGGSKKFHETPLKKA